MEHVTITGPNELGYYRLIPDEGYMLCRKLSPKQLYSEAETKTPDDFVAVAK